MKRKILKVVLSVIVVLAILVFVNFIPTWRLETGDMNKVSGEWVDVYYENEEAAARDVFMLADEETEEIAMKLGFTEKQDVKVFIYDNQKTMQTKKYGFVAPLLGLDWYIGDNIGTNVILTSPANPGKVHTYDDNKYAVMHEIVHAYVYCLNEDISLWLTEGVALYLSNGEAFSKNVLNYMEIPSYKDTCSNNPIRFSNCGGYTFAHTYIEYLEVVYGWDKVLLLIKTEDYEGVLGKSQQEIYNEWVSYIESYPY